MDRHRRAVSVLQLLAGGQVAGPESQVVPDKGCGVDDQQAATHFAGDDLERGGAHGGSHFPNLGILLLRLNVDRSDTAAGDDVVELVETD